MENKVLIIGLDGVPYNLIKRLVTRGKLPNIAKIMKNGVSGPLMSTLPPVSAPAWASFITGQNPGKHGIFGFYIRNPNTYGEGHVVSSVDVPSITLWKILNLSKKKVGIINLTLTYPPKKINGFMIAGLPSPLLLRNNIYPPELIEELDEYRIDIDYELMNIDYDYATLIHEISDVMKKRASVTFRLMRKYAWDVLMVVFIGTDKIQHMLWKCLDPKHPEYASEEARKYRETVLNYYQDVDRIVGEFLKMIDQDTILILMSDHGFRSISTKSVYINNWLMNLGLLEWNKKTYIKRMLFGILRNRIFGLGILYNLIKKKRRKGKKVFIRAPGELIDRPISGVDWSQTKAYHYPLFENMQGIAINLKGEKPEGVVNPGEDYNKLRDYIIKELHKLRDPKTGTDIVKNVFKREEIYWGPYVQYAPDIVFTMKDCYSASSELSTSLIGEVKVFRRSGVHDMEGFFVMAGKDVRKGAKISCDIIDISPTVLYIMNVPISRDTDGKILTQAFDSSYIKSNPVSYKSYEEVILEEKLPERPFSEEEEKEITKRLKQLGYL